MQKLILSIASAFILFSFATTSIAADPSPREKAGGTHIGVTILFKSSATLHFDFDSGTLATIENDLLGSLNPPHKQYTYQSKTQNATITVDLREIAAATVEK